jgi:CRISPR-associated protein Cas5h
MSKRLISFDLHADFGCLKKPDVNDGLMLTFNVLHKPALLGILGAVIGLRGYERKGELPDYYRKLKELPVGIEPLGHDKGNFTKTNIKYTNTVGYANSDGNLIVHEQTLIAPAYRIYLLVDLSNDVQQDLYNRLKANEAVYLPYIGKNEFSAWFDSFDTEGSSFRDYSFSEFKSTKPFRIDSLFVKKYPLKDKKQEPKLSIATQSLSFGSSFAYFERLPMRFDETLMQYELAEFAYSDWFYKPDSTTEPLLEIAHNNQTKVIQLF